MVWSASRVVWLSWDLRVESEVVRIWGCVVGERRSACRSAGSEARVSRSALLLDFTVEGSQSGGGIAVPAL